MGDFTIENGEAFFGEVEIYDPNGPEGITIYSEPNDIVFGEPNITELAIDPNTGDTTRLYTFPFEYLPETGGKKTYEIISIDTEGIIVTQEIIFRVKGNVPHFFVGCRVLGEPSGPTNPSTSEIWEHDGSDSTLTTWPIFYDSDYIYYQQMRINEDNRVETNLYKTAKTEPVSVNLWLWDLYDIKPTEEKPTITGRAYHPYETLARNNYPFDIIEGL